MYQKEARREVLTQRILDELRVEGRLLLSNWWILLLGASFQYVHGAFTAVAYHMHEPRETLKDLGFMLLPELAEQYDWVSESVFWTLFISFIVFSFTPFIRRKPKFYTVLLYSRFLCILCTCQTLRILSFLSTALPGPAYHCRPGHATATLAWPAHWWQNIFFDAGRQAAHSCGDLLFSSHTTFLLNGALTYSVYGSHLAIKAAVWFAVTCICSLIIASRKHYTVDVVVAAYVVPLVFFTWRRFWKVDRAAEEQREHGWAPVNGTGMHSAVDEADDCTGIVVNGGSDTASFVELASKGPPELRAPLKDAMGRWQHAGADSEASTSLYTNGSKSSERSSSRGSGPPSGGSVGAVEGAMAARLLKTVSSPPPERTDVVSGGSSTSVQPRGGAVTNRGSATTGLGRRYSQPEELSLAGADDASSDGFANVNLS